MKPIDIAKRLYGYLRPYMWPYFVAALVCMVLYSASSGLVPYLVKSLVDDIFEEQNREMLRLLPGLIVLVFLVRGVVNFGQAYLGEYVGQKIVFDLREELEAKVQHLPMSFFDQAATANVVARITSDVLLVRQALTDGAAAMIRDATTVIVLVTVTFFLDPVLAAIAFIVIPTVVTPLQALSRKMRRLSHSGLDTLGSLSALLQETIQGSRVVKAFGMADYEKRRFRDENKRLLKLYLRAARIKAFTAPMSEVFSAVGIAGVLWYGGMSVLSGDRTTGSFMALLTAVALIYEPFKKLVRTNNIVQIGLGAAERVFSILDVASEASEHPGHLAVDEFEDAVRFEKVSFAYGKENVLHDVDLQINCGDVVALVGPSGGGKSTLADLIPRFYEVGGGRVTLDGHDIRDIELASLRSLISVVTQQTFLFNDTVRNNVAYGHIERSEEEIVEAARAANAHEFIVDFTEGYDTVVGELGAQLSGGQRQRIAIARALLKDAPLLILDEATSSLDAESERLVQSAIERLVVGRTTLVIAHRLSTIRKADKIAVVEAGRIADLGTHEDLLERSPLYQRLYSMQFQDEETSGGQPVRPT